MSPKGRKRASKQLMELYASGDNRQIEEHRFGILSDLIRDGEGSSKARTVNQLLTQKGGTILQEGI